MLLVSSAAYYVYRFRSYPSVRLLLVTIQISEPTKAVIQLQTQYVDDKSEGLSKPFQYFLDFSIFHKGAHEPLYFSSTSPHSVLVELDLLEPGEYVVHVSF